MPKKTAPPAPQAVVPATSHLELIPSSLREKANITAVELCRDVLRINRGSLHKWIKTGHWPHPVKLGTRTLWPTAVVAEQLALRLAEAQAKDVEQGAVA